MRTSLSLLELNQLVRQTIAHQMPDEYWVEAEVSDIRVVNGHCYLQLIQKDEHSRTPVAQAAACCWRQTWMLIRPHFERITGQCLGAGMKVLLQVYAQFHENYGFSWIITDIDPTYTIGDMARRRQEIIRQLKDEGVFDLNKELELPMFCQRIAVISSANAAGYGDFCHQLRENAFGFHFHAMLFPAIMQGEQVEQSIISALDAVNSRLSDFDCVVIIRGGGAVADLSGFDTLALAENVANFPLPVITGIGHERDESVLDMIAHTRVKTPTAAAAFLIDHLKRTADRIDEARDRLAQLISRRMLVEHERLERLARLIPTLFAVAHSRQEARLSRLLMRCASHARRRVGQEEQQRLARVARLSAATQSRLLREHHRLQLLQQRASAADPALMLQRGYSITLYKGKVLRHVQQIQPGERIVTRLSKGSLSSVVVDNGPLPHPASSDNSLL